mgnify:CR=1 FL=1
MLETHIFYIKGKNLCKSVKSVGLVLCPTDYTDLHGYNDKGLYATMNRWRIDPWLYGDSSALTI